MARRLAGISGNIMQKPIRTGSNHIPPPTNGDARRRCRSWIESFVEYTDNLESAIVFRKWAAITAIAAALEQKVFVNTSSYLYPNLYVVLIGPPGIGKTKTITAVGKLLRSLEDFHIASTSVTAASLVDELAKASVRIVEHPGVNEYNSMLLLADELSAFMHDYDNALIGNLTTFYDVSAPYSHSRRTGDLRIHIERPQLSMLVGSTTSNFMRTLPDSAWDQGFMSRVIMVFSDDKIVSDDIFERRENEGKEELAHDLKSIYSLQGQFKVSDEYRNALNKWRKGGNAPLPSHPRLVHYNTRRTAHLLKLSMVSCVDRGDDLRIEEEDFKRSLAWLCEAERLMPYVFSSQNTIDSRVMGEIAHFCEKEQPETKVIRFAAERVPAHSVMKVLDLMITSGMIKITGVSNLGIRRFKTYDCD
jgi:hypothetical protein